MKSRSVTSDPEGRFIPKPRASVAAIPAYTPGEASVADFARVIKLSSNESPLGTSAKARAAFAAKALELQRYPDPGAAALREAIARKYSLRAGRVVCGCGSEELLHLAARAYAEGGNTVVASQYGFMGHRIAALAAGANLVTVPENNYCVDFGRMSAAVNERTTVVYVANPANPTGTVVSGKVIREFHKRLPPSVLLVIDAAYAEFAAEVPEYESGLELVQEGARNVLVTRTFSKMYGLAGLRIGWGYAAPEIIDPIERVRPAFNANSVAQATAIAALEDDEFVERSLTVNQQGLVQLRQGLERLNIYTTRSVCNFVLARFPGGSSQAAAAFLALKQRGVIVRPVDGYGLADCLRISVGMPEDNAAVIEGLREFVGGL